MPRFTFEVWGSDDLLLLADERDLPSGAEAWGHLEVLALQLRSNSRVRLCVKDPDGVVIIRTGLAATIASIERCPSVACPIKDLLAGRGGARLDDCAPCMSIPVAEIPRLELPEPLCRRPAR
jgi:hypothetical protein